MIDLLDESARILIEHQFAATVVSAGKRVLLFENNTVLGFLFTYDTPRELIETWEADSKDVIVRHRAQLQASRQKAWNTYVVLLCREEASVSADELGVIEEDLTGTRKIARAGIADTFDVRQALLSLLPIQSSPKLDAIDLAAEVRARAGSLPLALVDGFLANAPLNVLMSILDDNS